MNSCPPQRVEWHKGPLLGFDVESTGVDVETDRIVTAALVFIDPGQPAHATNRLVDPGVEIPTGASDIHGITTEHAREHGEQPRPVILDVIGTLTDAIKANIPIVGMNIVYDLTLLDREARRHDIAPLTDTVDHVSPIVDILVLDKQTDRYRKGSRNLTALCTHYSITLNNAHNSAADALAACRIAWAIAQRHPKLQINPHQLHQNQIGWAATQRANFAEYRRKQGNPLDDENGAWPIRPTTTKEHVNA